jgi:hypothetical protein
VNGSHSSPTLVALHSPQENKTMATFHLPGEQQGAPLATASQARHSFV